LKYVPLKNYMEPDPNDEQVKVTLPTGKHRILPKNMAYGIMFICKFVLCFMRSRIEHNFAVSEL